MRIESKIPENTCCDMRDSWNIISKLSSEFGVIVHGPSGCENEFFYSKNKNNISSYSTGLNEVDITLGTGKLKLEKKVEYILETNKNIKVLFILGTCSSELIGDYIDDLEEKYKDRVRIIVLHTSGMRGAGYHYTKYNVFTSLFNLETYSGKKTNSINIFFQDGMQNELFRNEIKEFLLLFGIEVNSFLNSNITYKELKSIKSVSKNYLIGRDNDFEEILKFLYKEYGIPYKVLDLPIGEKFINKFYSNIYFDFFTDKKKYIVNYLRKKKEIEAKINYNFINNTFIEYYLYTNSKIYFNLLKEYNLKVEFKKIKYDTGINTSHKFNFSNKIIISKFNINNIDFKLLGNKAFKTLNNYMGFIGKYNFYIDFKNQYIYNNFLDRYSKYL